VFELTTNYRQANDLQWHRALMEIRRGIVSDETDALLKSRIVGRGPDDTMLYARNMSVDAENRDRLEDLDTPRHYFESEFKFCNWLSAARRMTLAKQMHRDCAPHRVCFKIGARVVHTVNAKNGLVNGSIGVVIGFDEKRGWPIVEFEDKLDPTVKLVHTVGQWSWESPKEHANDPAGIADAVLYQIPMKLAFALTIHKTQGMTITKATVDLAGIFEPGQVFVAISRVPLLRNITIVHYNRRLIEAHAEADAWVQSRVSCTPTAPSSVSAASVSSGSVASASGGAAAARAPVDKHAAR
jgi:hypothetical protein